MQQLCNLDRRISCVSVFMYITDDITFHFINFDYSLSYIYCMHGIDPHKK